MIGFGLRKNLVFDWVGEAFRIDRLQPNGDVLLERMNDGNLQIVTSDILLTEYGMGNISTRATESVLTNNTPLFSRPLKDLSDYVRNELNRRKAYLHRILDHGTPIFTATYLKPLIKLAADEMGDKKPPSVTSIYRWYKALQCNNDTRALISRTDLRGSKRPRQTDLVLQLISEATEQAFKVSPRATGRQIYTFLLAKIEMANRNAIQEKPLKPPGLRTLYRLLARSDVYEMTRLKEGRTAADKKLTIVKVGVKTSRILERVEIDHTPLDLFLIDEKSLLPLGRPTLTVVVDHFSRMLLGYYLSFDSPSTAAVMGALRHAILPKMPADSVIPSMKTEHSWPCYGRPEVMVVDNGLEFHSNDLESVVYDLGTRIQYCPKHQPRFKGVVERYLKTVNYFFAHQLPGTSFARFYHRGDYDSQRSAILTFAEFKQIFEKWVVDVYSQTLHRGIGVTPWSRWHEGLNYYEPELPADIQALQSRIGKVTERALRKDGINLNGIRYNSDSLGSILRKFGTGVRVRILYDTEDLGAIQVWSPDDTEPVRVEALNQKFAKGLTEKQNESIRKALLEKGASTENRAALERARYELAESVQELMVSRKQTDRRRSAALRGISSSQPNGTPPLVNKSDQKLTKVNLDPIFAKVDQTRSDIPNLLPTFQIKRGGQNKR